MGRCVRDLMNSADRKKKKRNCPDCRRSLNSRLMLICYDELKAAYADGRGPPSATTFPRYHPSPCSDDQPLWYQPSHQSKKPSTLFPSTLRDDLCFWLVCCTWGEAMDHNWLRYYKTQTKLQLISTYNQCFSQSILCFKSQYSTQNGWYLNHNLIYNALLPIPILYTDCTLKTDIEYKKYQWIISIKQYFQQPLFYTNNTVLLSITTSSPNFISSQTVQYCTFTTCTAKILTCYWVSITVHQHLILYCICHNQYTGKCFGYLYCISGFIILEPYNIITLWSVMLPWKGHKYLGINSTRPYHICLTLVLMRKCYYTICLVMKN